jgi:hydroxymethylpyrimidine/phosphomethylpyrimidine kinase
LIDTVAYILKYRPKLVKGLRLNRMCSQAYSSMVVIKGCHTKPTNDNDITYYCIDEHTNNNNNNNNNNKEIKGKGGLLL